MVKLFRTSKWQLRYETFIPEELRKLAEERGVPKPNRYVPSAQGRATTVVGFGEGPRNGDGPAALHNASSDKPT